jgi:choline kinase
MVLVAGLGSRLGADRDLRPKCLTPVAGRAIVDYTLEACAAADVADVVLVIGFEGEQIRRHVGLRGASAVRFAENPDFARTGTAASILAGLRLVSDDKPLLIIEGDTAYEPAALRRLLCADGAIAVAASAFDPALHSGTKLFVDAADRALHVVHATATPPDEGALRVFKTANLTLFRTYAARSRLRLALEAAVAAWGPAAPFEFALASLSASPGIRVVDLGDLKWFEIDTAEDLAVAHTLFATDAHAAAI